jgi:uncharacterized protein (TIGR00290 family)
MIVKVVAAWSGGKDSCFAYCKALKEGLDVASLVTFMRDENMSNFHGIRSDLLNAQVKALNKPLVKRITTPSTYEQLFKETLLQLKDHGVEGLVTGDIYEVAGHEERWLERVLSEVGLKPIRPLWQGNTTEIFKEFIAAGFKATVVRTKLPVLGEEWIGRQLNAEFLSDIQKHPEVDPCGEGGEYHTVVTDGPIFNSSIELTKTSKLSVGGFGRLEILDFKVNPKS